MKPSDLGFPADRFPEFRHYRGFDQLALAAKLAACDDPRFQLVCAPTGSGKSLLALASAALRGPAIRTLVLTVTRGQQLQYGRDFPFARLVWGHRNYECARGAFPGDDLDDPEYRCHAPRNECGWVRDVEAAARSRTVVANYALWMALARYSDPGILGEFDVLVLDEAHNAPKWLTDFVAVDLHRGALRKWLRIELPSLRADREEFPRWSEWALGAMSLAVARASEVEDAGERRRLGRMAKDLALVSSVTEPGMEIKLGQPWLAIRTESGVRFTPRWGSDFAERYLFRTISHVLLMSATLTPETGDYLGIPRGDSRYLEVPSPFDPRRRPIVWIPTARVDHRMSEAAKDKVYGRVDEIIAACVGAGAGKGLIQTQSYERAREVVARSKFRPLLVWHDNSFQLRDALARFEAADGFKVFVSPSVKEGFDLGYVYWQIILKMPFPDRRDPLEKSRIEADNRYADVVIGQDLLQQFGRIVRSAGDYGITWIVDDHWAHVRKSSPFPGWSREAWKTSDTIEPLTRDRVDGLRELPVVQLASR